jgi:hypothetical protein
MPLWNRLLGSLSSVPSTLEYVGTADSSASTVDISSLTAAGRLCVLVDNAFNLTTTIPTSVTPSGFSTASDQGGTFLGSNSIRHTVSYKILDGTEGSLSGLSGVAGTRKVAAVFKFSTGSIASVSTAGLAQVLQSTEAANQTIPTSGQVAPLILVGTFGAVSNRNIVGLGSGSTTLPGIASQAVLCFRIVNSGTQSATMASGVSGIQAMTSFFINAS